MIIFKRFTGDILAGLAVLFVLCLFLNPFDILMLTMGAMTVLSLFALAVLVFAAFVWREKAHDEREALLVGSAGRIAYLSGAGILSLGIIVQTLSHALDLWLVLALAGMVCTKLIATIYYQK